MRKDYVTVKGFGETEIIIQKSRFLTYVNRAETEQQAQAFIEEIKSKHKSANHNCSAYMIGEHDSIQKANDDGEPSGTAGVPMLEVLKKQGLKDFQHRNACRATGFSVIICFLDGVMFTNHVCGAIMIR